MGSVHARGDTFLTFGLKALTETNTSRLATEAETVFFSEMLVSTDKSTTQKMNMPSSPPSLPLT
jgi:hypothetical protein